MILSKAYLEAKGDDGFLSHPIGSGPYKFVQRTAGSFLKLEAVDKHWRQGTPRYKTMWFRLVPEETTRIAMLRQGKADMIDVSRERAKELVGARAAKHLVVSTFHSLGVRILQPATLRTCDRGHGGWTLGVETQGRIVRLDADFLANARGRAGGGAGPRQQTARRTLALYGYWRGSSLPQEPHIEAGDEAW